MSIPDGDKSILLIRHGTTEMNEYLAASIPYGRPGFVDPGKRDTRLTPGGRAQAQALNAEMRRMQEAGWGGVPGGAAVQLVAASPLSRAIDTASLVFEGIEGPTRVVSPLIRERLWLSSDVGRPPEELAAEFGDRGWDFSGLEREWWYTGAEDGTAAGRPAGTYLHPGEPEAVFQARLQEFKRWLQARPEQRIAAVAHWGVIYALTGKSLANCETHRCLLSELLAAPIRAV